jgi:hypothetical protein
MGNRELRARNWQPKFRLKAVRSLESSFSTSLRSVLEEEV